MPLPSRNAPCPCGSGRKYKRCCGEDRAAARELQESAARASREQESALTRLGALAGRSPRLVPLVDGVENWAELLRAGRMSPDDALAGLPQAETARLLETFEQLYPAEVDEARLLCSKADMAAAVLLGAIFAAQEDAELLAVPPEYLGTIEETVSLSAEPIDAVALTFEGWQLWGRAEGAVAEAEVVTIPEWLPDDEADRRFEAIMNDVTERLYGAWHAARVARMVHNVRQQLPFEEFPRASELLAAGCERFDADPRLGKRIAATLLADALPLEPPVLADELLERWAA